MGDNFCSRCGLKFNAFSKDIIKVGNEYKILCSRCLPMVQRDPEEIKVSDFYTKGGRKYGIWCKWTMLYL